MRNIQNQHEGEESSKGTKTSEQNPAKKCSDGGNDSHQLMFLRQVCILTGLRAVSGCLTENN